jgi:hypothetical protein
MWHSRMVVAVLTVWWWLVPGGRDVAVQVCGDADGSSSS